MENNKPISEKFPAKEKVKSKKAIEHLFSSKNQVFEFPFKIYCLFTETQLSFPQILISVPKRNFKKAVDRNRLKRQIREAYRKNKNSLKVPFPAAIALVFVSKEKMKFELIQKKLILALSRLKNTV